MFGFQWNKLWLLIFLVLLHVLEVPLKHPAGFFPAIHGTWVWKRDPRSLLQLSSLSFGWVLSTHRSLKQLTKKWTWILLLISWVCDEINQGLFGCQGDIFTVSYYAEMELDTDCTAWRMKNALKRLQHRAIETDTVPVQSPGIKPQPSPTSQLQIVFKHQKCSLSLSRGNQDSCWLSSSDQKHFLEMQDAPGMRKLSYPLLSILPPLFLGRHTHTNSSWFMRGCVSVQSGSSQSQKGRR